MIFICAKCLNSAVIQLLEHEIILFNFENTAFPNECRLNKIDFRTIIYRIKHNHETPQVREQVKKLILKIKIEMSVAELMFAFELKGRRNFMQNYLQPSLQAELIEMTQPDSPNSPTQKYLLTSKGEALKAQLKKNELMV